MSNLAFQFHLVTLNITYIIVSVKQRNFQYEEFVISRLSFGHKTNDKVIDTYVF